MSKTACPILLTAWLFMGMLPSAAEAQSTPGGAGTAWLDNTRPACAACHGAQGSAPVSPAFPVIAGQHKSYLLHALTAYRSGDRNNVVMGSLVQGMTDAQLMALAEYFSNQSSDLRTLPRQ